MSEIYDVAIVGAGPAGLAAAVAATAAGAHIAVVDSAPRPGGQFWRHGPSSGGAASLSAFHSMRGQYRRLRTRFDAAIAAGQLDYHPLVSVWLASTTPEGFLLHLADESSGGQVPETVAARALLVATGAYDRQLPIPGWQLPGVMAAGGIQAFIKQNGFPPGKRFVVAGTGPFLLPVAVNVLQAGASVAAVCESAALGSWVPHIHRSLAVPSKLLEGGRYGVRLLAARVPYRQHTIITEILGEGRVEAVRTARVDSRGRVRAGTERLITGVDGVGLGWGFTPQLDVALQLGAETEVGADGSLVLTADRDGRTTVTGLFAAGEVTGVGGAGVSVLEGSRAGSAAAARAKCRAVNQGRPGAAKPGARNLRQGRGGRVSAALRDIQADNQRRFAAAMHAVHAVPPEWRTWVDDPCLVCRCEEVTAGSIRRARTELTATDQRTAKGVTRAGMGWCQARTCGFAVAALAEDGTPSLDSLRRAARRPIARPVPLNRLSDLAPSEPSPESPPPEPVDEIFTRADPSPDDDTAR